MSARRQVREVRGRVRHGYRMAHRLALGATRLGPGATSGWMVSQIRSRGAKTPGEVGNSSFTWVTATDAGTTLVWLHNYWSEAYRIARPVVSAQLLDSDGLVVEQWRISLEPDSTDVIDVRDRCRAASVPLPFQGQLLLEFSAEGLVVGRPVQVFADYCRDDGSSSGVHGQYGLQRRPLGQAVGEMRVEAGPGIRSAVVVVNSYAGPGGPRPMRASIEVREGGGALRRADLTPLGPRASRVVWLDEVFPDLDRFLGGNPGSAVVRLPCPSSRLASFTQFDGGVRLVVNHGTVDARLNQQRGCPRDWRDSEYVLSAFALCDKDRDTTLSFINTWGPIPADSRVHIRFSGPNGHRLASHQLTVLRGAFATVSARAVLTAAGVTLPAVAHAEVTVHPLTSVDERPVLTNVLVGLVDGGRLVGEMLVGGGFLNGPVPPGCGLFDVRRTRVFSRVHLGPGDGARTQVFVAHPVGVEDYDTVSHPTVKLLDLAGHVLGSVGLELAPHGCRLFDVADAFPEAVRAGHRVGVVRVRATDARLIGSHISARTGISAVTVDHLVGG